MSSTDHVHDHTQAKNTEDGAEEAWSVAAKDTIVISALKQAKKQPPYLSTLGTFELCNARASYTMPEVLSYLGDVVRKTAGGCTHT